jgi:hypothetical protein
MKIQWPSRLGLFRLSLLAVVVGVVAGFGAVGFRALIGLIHNVAFSGSFSIDYNASVFTPPSPWGAFVILVPVFGGIVLTLSGQQFRSRSTRPPRPRSHGRHLLQQRRDSADRGGDQAVRLTGVIESLTATRGAPRPLLAGAGPPPADAARFRHSPSSPPNE